MHRKVRSGFAEVIFCSGKADAHFMSIFERLYERDGEVFGTRASEHQYHLAREKFPQTVYDPNFNELLKSKNPEGYVQEILPYVQQEPQTHR